MTSKQTIRETNICAVTAAALSLFYQNGIDHSTVNEIAALANVSKVSIFRYFTSKTEIVEAATSKLFQDLDQQFQQSDYACECPGLTGMQLAKKHLDFYLYLIESQPQFLNYLCEVVLFFSKHNIPYDFPNFNRLGKSWRMAVERGMSDKSIAFIEHHETFHRTVHNLFMGTILRLYLREKDLAVPAIAAELTGQAKRIIDMALNYLEP